MWAWATHTPQAKDQIEEQEIAALFVQLDKNQDKSMSVEELQLGYHALKRHVKQQLVLERKSVPLQEADQAVAAASSVQSRGSEAPGAAEDEDEDEEKDEM